MREPKIECRWCKGTGHRKLSPPELRVFKAVLRLKKPSCPEIFREIAVHYNDPTVANFYVKRLVKLKLVRKLPVNGERFPRYAAI